MVSLAVGDAQRAAALRNGFVGDVLGYSRQAHAAGDVQDGLDDQAVDLICGQPLDELTVDLQQINLHRFEVGEAREAGAEIVQRNGGSERAQAFADRSGVIKVGDDVGLGQLEHKIGGIRGGVCERPRDVAHESWLGDCLGGEVDGKPRAGRCGGHDGCLGSYPAIDRGHEPEALGSRQEGSRRDQLRVAAEHADQQLVHDDRAGAQIDDRLGMQNERPRNERLLQAP